LLAAINDCTNGANNCSPFGTCIYTGPGVFSCACNANYTGNGVNCTGMVFLFFFFFLVCHHSHHSIIVPLPVGINNCTNGVNNCAPTGSTSCSNLGPGTYSCACNSGYNGTGTACTAINYCTFGNNTCAAVGSTCNYTGPGTFTCTCDRGYSGTGVSCTAINYCLGGNNCSSNAACNYTGLEPSLAHVTLDIRGMDTAVRLLTTVHKHHHLVRQRARRVPTLALEHIPALA